MTIRIDTRRQQPLYDVTATKSLEQAALAREVPHALMKRAGAAIARLSQAIAPCARHIWIACGQGNNGGDGFEAATLLHRAGRSVSIGFGGDAARLPADARASFDSAVAAGVPFDTEPPPGMTAQDLVIDGLLGIGGTARAAPPWMQHALAVLQGAPCPVLCIDAPSGLDASTGQYAEGFAPEHPPRMPRHTLSLLTLKPGLFTGQGRDAAGTVWFDDLGIDPSWFERTPPDAWLSGKPADPVRAYASHKGNFGDVIVLGGEGLGRRGMGMVGAALLASSAALHGGAGRVLVALLDASMDVDVSQPELMLRTPDAMDLSRGTVVCGCGGGEAIAGHLPRVLAESHRLVLDADALNAIASDSGLQAQLRARSERGAVTILTPHPLEAARLLQTDAATVQADRLKAAKQLTDRYGCVAAVKGSGTVIAAPGLAPAINPTGNGRLASAGTGDVLAGMTGSRLAAASPGSSLPMQTVFEVARDAVYEHGALADHWPSQQPLTASSLARRSAQASS